MPGPITPEQIDAALDIIRDGKSLRHAAEQLGFHKTQFLRAVESDTALRDQYARARETQADTFVDEMIEIADNQAIPPDARRVMNDARKWAAGKQAAKKYGDKVTQEVTGPNGEAVQIIQLVAPSDRNG